jgi:hypothetical protein
LSFLFADSSDSESYTQKEKLDFLGLRYKIDRMVRKKKIMAVENLENETEYRDCPIEFVTAPEHLEILNQLIQYEPIFHHPEFGTTRQDFENMTDAAFWEVGASGRRYSREYVITEVLKRYEDPQYRSLE